MIIDMALSPKSNNGYSTLDKALNLIETKDTGNVPNHIKTSSPEYKYPHDYPNHFVKQQYLPDKIKNIKFFEPKISSKYEERTKCPCKSNHRWCCDHTGICR